MNDGRLDIDELFGQARAIESEVSFEEMKSTFLKALVVGAGGMLATKSLLKLIAMNKWTFIVGTILTGTTISIVATSMSSEEPNETAVVSQIPESEPEQTNDLLILDEPSSDEPDPIIIEENEGHEEENEPQTVDETTNIVEIAVNAEHSNTSRKKPAPKLDDTTETVIYTPNAGEVRFIISPKTSVEALEKIEKKAQEAGIKLKFEYIENGDILQDLKFEAKLNHKTNSRKGNEVEIIIFENEDEEIVFGWIEDKKGKATSIFSELPGNDRVEVLDIMDPMEPTLLDLEEIVIPEIRSIRMPDFSVILLEDDCPCHEEFVPINELMRELESEMKEIQREIDREAHDIQYTDLLNQILREIEEETKVLREEWNVDRMEILEEIEDKKESTEELKEVLKERLEMIEQLQEELTKILEGLEEKEN